MFYYCRDPESNTQYVIKEIRHKDVLDAILGGVKKSIFGETSSSFLNEKEGILEDYLANNPENSTIIEFSQGRAVVVDNGIEKKFFFSDTEAFSSYEITVTGSDEKIVNSYFKKIINSIRPKTL